jgi:HTH-type transcriptional regulator / antitoxin MqsA
MTQSLVELPPTLTSPETGALLKRGTRPFIVTYKTETVSVDLPGYYADGEGDGVHVGDDMAVVDAALRQLKEAVDGLPSPDKIRALRQSLNLSQREAGLLLKVGENAFDKYERGISQPSGPTIQLMRLLERHPHLVSELR